MPPLMRHRSTQIRGRGRKRRHGAALLWTLAVLILTLTATLSVAQIAATAASWRNLDQTQDLADTLLPAAEEAITHWLQHHSSKVMLPPDVDQPQTPVLDDLIIIDELQLRLTITAFDQCGMMPLRAILKGSPLRLALDDDVLRTVDASGLADVADHEPLGLDRLSVSIGPDRGVFPRRVNSDQENHATNDSLRVFTVAEAQAPAVIAPSESVSASDAEIPLGAILATHAGRTGPINVNTAPAWLLEAALRQAGRSGLDQILDNRAAGRSSAVPQVAAGARSFDESSIPAFVSASELWSFRIDARCAFHSREGRFTGMSWWAIYQRNSSSPWTCVQRLAITD